ncbi:MAG: sigma 54-interacting transcriptional regulator [Desulfobacterales bacterium]|nr:MAG: sigma 54-interacting transcriptional regulator [Desulfobacterales bacterium]
MEIRKIGTYLVENQSCDDQMINAALRRQLDLERDGIYKPLGQILIEIGGLKLETLDLVLKRQGKDMLRSIELFEPLPPDSISKIVEVAECQVFTKGEIIIHEGDQGDAFYQIVSGSARVYRLSEDGIEVTLNTLGPGEGFGEMALFTGEPRSASVSAQEVCSFLVISKRAFDRLVAKYPEFSLLLSKSLSSRLARGSSDLVSATSTEKAYQRFISEQSFGIETQLVGRSKAVKKLQSRMNIVAQNDKPILIQGEPGTEKGEVASLIHRGSNRKEGPFLVINVKTASLGRVDSQHRKLDPIRLELAQNSTLFGHVKGALPFARERRLGLLQVGNNGTVVIENIENLAEDVQTKLVDFIKYGYFRPLGSPSTLHSSVRILATSAVDLDQLVQEDKFSEELRNTLRNQILVVPPLRERKKDLRQLIGNLIEHYSEQVGKSVVGINNDVYKSIMDYDWPGNTDELDVVIRRAVNLVQGNRLTLDDIFIGTAPQVAGKLSFNILKLDRVQQLFQSRAFPGSIQLITAFFCILIIAYGFFGKQKSDYNLSLELTWGIWEPLVVLSCILAARIWCAVCPVGALSSIISRKYSLRRSIPSFIRNKGVYLGAIGLGLIVLSEVIFNMPFSPRATAFLILSIALPAVILAFIYRRRAWCRFLCPLGKLVGFFSRGSLLELRANHNICNSDCMEHSCYIGSGNQEGCPVFEAPFSLQTNQNCILCGNCIKNCQNHSPILNLRIPGHELWAFQKPDSTISVLGIFIIGTQLFRGLEKTGYFHQYLTILNQHWIFYSIFIVIITLLTYLFVRHAGIITFNFGKTSSQEKISLMVYTLLPLVTAFELSFHFERMITRGTQLLPTLGQQLGFFWDSLGMKIGPWLVKVCQTAFIIIGVFWSKAVLVRLFRSQQDTSSKNLSMPQSWAIWLFAAVYVWLFWAG